MTGGGEVLPDLLPRIRGAADHAREARDAAELAQQRRDELIVTAADAGLTNKAIGQAAGIHPSLVTRIVGNAAVVDVV
jgi:hypothetical protein